MQWEMKASRFEGEWVVEAINEEADGDIYVTVFAGPLAQERAAEYAAWKGDASFAPPTTSA